MSGYRLLVDLYRVICQPTSFADEARRMGFRRRLIFMARIAPVMLAAAAATVGSLAVILEVIGPILHWHAPGSWLLQTAIGVAVGLAVGALWNVAMGVAVGMIWGPASWLVGSVVLPLFVHPPGPVLSVLATTIPLGLAIGVGLGVTGSTSRVTVTWGIAFGLALGAVVGRPAPLAFSIAWMTAFSAGYYRLEWYALDMEVTFLQFLRALHRPAHARSYLRASPIHWREPIWPPLPGLRAFLCLLGEHDYPTGIDECLFIIAERPTQAAAARSALIHIIAGRLARLDTIQKIAAAGAEVERPAAEDVQLPPMLQATLPELSTLTRLAEQHLSATLPHNRRRALQRLTEGADDLARRLAVANGPLPRMLLSATRAWRDVAAAELEKIGRAEQAAGFVHNPFVFGQPIEETDTNLFVGRRDVVRQIEISLLGGTAKPTLVLWGPRRMGKTSVLLQLPRLLGSEFVPAFLDLQAMQVRESLVAFLRSISASSVAALHRRGTSVPSLESVSLSEDPFSRFASWMQKVEEHIGPERYLLLCLDEFERLETSVLEGRLPRELLDQIRHIIQHHPRIVLLFAGSHRPDEMELDWSDILISTKLIRVDYLREEEATQLITRPVPDFGISYDSGAIEKIIERTRCQPYLIQALCYELTNHLNVEGRREATASDVGVATERTLESAHLYFAEMWRHLDDHQRSLLKVIAASPEGRTVGELCATTPQATEHTETTLGGLTSRGIVDHDEASTWRFQVPMVAQWVREQRRG